MDIWECLYILVVRDTEVDTSRFDSETSNPFGMLIIRWKYRCLNWSSIFKFLDGIRRKLIAYKNAFESYPPFDAHRRGPLEERITENCERKKP